MYDIKSLFMYNYVEKLENLQNYDDFNRRRKKRRIDTLMCEDTEETCPTGLVRSNLFFKKCFLFLFKKILISQHLASFLIGKHLRNRK